MLKKLIPVIALYFLVSCSSDTDFNAISSFIATKDDSNDVEEIDDSEEEITAIPPTVISGSYLVCVFIPATSEISKISCHLEKNNKILNEIILVPSDLRIVMNGKEILPVNGYVGEPGVIYLEFEYEAGTDITVKLKEIGGKEISQEFLDTGNFESIIKSEGKLEESDEIKPNGGEKDSGKSSGDQEESPDDSEKPLDTQNKIGCDDLSGDWVFIPGDPSYGTSDFCLMKYEAKCIETNGQNCNLSINIPRSTPENTPWVSISQLEAIQACESLGDEYHLITNQEWMTIATNIVLVESNWSSSLIGNGVFKRGHTDSNPAQACASSSDDTLNVVESDCSAKETVNDDFLEQRTHTLLNGQEIWDLSGNVWEWTDYFNIDEKPTPLGNNYFEFTDLVGTNLMPLTDLVPQVAIDNSWSSTFGIGKYFPGNAGFGGALRRGGYWDISTDAGLFSASLSSPTGQKTQTVGFRCATTAP